MVLGILAGVFSLARGDDPERGEPAAARPLREMQDRVASLTVEQGAEGSRHPVKLIETAILRYNSPRGLDATTDGAVWVWGTAGRPAAIAAIFFEEKPEGRKWSCELTALADKPLALRSPAGWEWKPPRSELQWISCPELPEASGVPPVSDNVTARTRQMKDLARQFSASETFNQSQIDQLRLLIRPLHRYSDPDQGLVDGGLFAFTSGTNPEAMLLLEARRDEGGETAWHFSFARMGAAASEARLGEKVVWTCPDIVDWDLRGPYYSSFGTDEEVFKGPGVQVEPGGPIKTDER